MSVICLLGGCDLICEAHTLDSDFQIVKVPVDTALGVTWQVASPGCLLGTQAGSGRIGRGKQCHHNEAVGIDYVSVAIA